MTQVTNNDVSPTGEGTQEPSVLVVWRKWFWFNYGHKEFKIKGFA